MMRNLTKHLILGLCVLAPAAWAAGSVQYLRELDAQEWATQKDLVNVIAMFLGETQQGGDYEASLALLKEKGILRDKGNGFSFDPEERLERGVASLLFARALGLKGGWFARVFGLGPRAAYKDMASRGYVRPHGTHSPMTGADLLGMMRLMVSDRRRGAL